MLFAHHEDLSVPTLQFFNAFVRIRKFPLCGLNIRVRVL